MKAFRWRLNTLIDFEFLIATGRMFQITAPELDRLVLKRSVLG